MNKIVTSAVIVSLLGVVGYLLYKRRKDSQLQPIVEPKVAEKKPEGVLKIVPKAELKLKDQLKKIQENVIKSGGIKKPIIVDDIVVQRDKKALELQLLPKRPVFTGGGSGAVVIETNIDKNVAPQRIVGRKEVPFNKPSDVLSEFI
jgi:Flp pilus assembly protein CpaB